MAVYRRGWNNGTKTVEKRPTGTRAGLSCGTVCYLFLLMISYCRYLMEKPFTKQIFRTGAMLATECRSNQTVNICVAVLASVLVGV